MTLEHGPSLVGDHGGATPSLTSHDHHTRRILTQIASGVPVTQRSLSHELGIALGLTNLLVRRLVKKGYVKVKGLKRNRVRYLITPTGIAEKTRVSRAYLENTIRLYTETRENIRASFELLSAGWPGDEPSPDATKRVVFYGAGEVAEIGYVSLQGSDLRLVGLVDDRLRHTFFGLPVLGPESLHPTHLNGEPFGRLVVMSFRKADKILERLRARGFPGERVFVIRSFSHVRD